MRDSRDLSAHYRLYLTHLYEPVVWYLAGGVVLFKTVVLGAISTTPVVFNATETTAGVLEVPRTIPGVVLRKFLLYWRSVLTPSIYRASVPALRTMSLLNKRIIIS